MKEIKSVKRDINENLKQEYQLYSNKVILEREYIKTKYDDRTQEVGCQHDGKTKDLICTCRNGRGSRKHQESRENRYFSTSNQIYHYSKSRSFTDIGIGSVKAFQKKKVKRIYLPETGDRGVGSSDLSSFVNRRTKPYRGDSYYDYKKTSSKCVGGIVDYATEPLLSEKLSPIVHTQSATTSIKQDIIATELTNTEIGSNTIVTNLVTATTQVDTEHMNDLYKSIETETDMKLTTKSIDARKEATKSVVQEIKPKQITVTVTTGIENKPLMEKRLRDTEKEFSSDSLVQHVHNLEIPSDDKQSRTSLDPMENKLEKEYRRLFSTKTKEKASAEKPIPDFKSTSVLRRRFEALRRGKVKKEDLNTNPMIETKVSSPESIPSRKDVSIASDPPSLEARSYSHTKKYSPFPSYINDNSLVNKPRTSYKKSFTGRKEKTSSHWRRVEEEDSEDLQGVKGMFKLWGKKFNLEDECYKKPSVKTEPNINFKQSSESPKKMERKKVVEPQKLEEEKKEGRKFFFFKRKSKDKEKTPYKSKKGVTAGRCEVGDGLMIKIGAANNYPSMSASSKKDEKSSDEYEEMKKRAWLAKYMTSSIDSLHSAQVRWNNKTYATSSSTVFELMDNVYNDTGVVFRSKSEVTTGDSSYYKPYNNHTRFVQQDIEAWMIPRTIPDRRIEIPVQIRSIPERKDKTDNIEVRISDQKWIIDKSKAFSQKIEVVLHSKNVVKLNNQTSAEYLRIDIPKGFFSDSSTPDDECPNQSSDEQVYKIVEYETPISTANIKKYDGGSYDLNMGDHISNDIKVTVSVKNSNDFESKILETVIKRPPVHRDVVIQGSNVYFPKRCDVIGVGIITQRDIREIRKPILKIQDYSSDEEEESTHVLRLNHKKCEFAESYLQDYYRNWTGMDFYSWCVSDSHIQCCSENNSETTCNYQGDGSRSCPNIYDDYYQILSSCGTSSCSHCNHYVIEQKTGTFSSKLKKKFKKKDKEANNEEKRVLPKDSLEVFRKRKVYALQKNNKRGCAPSDDKPYSVPSIEDKGAQDTVTRRSCCRYPEEKQKKKTCKKHVSMPDCDLMNDMYNKQMSDKIEGILAFKGAAGCDSCKTVKTVPSKHSSVNEKLNCAILPPHCKESCEGQKTPPCSKKDFSPSRTPTSCPPTPPKLCPPPSPPPCSPPPPKLHLLTPPPKSCPPTPPPTLCPPPQPKVSECFPPSPLCNKCKSEEPLDRCSNPSCHCLPKKSTCSKCASPIPQKKSCNSCKCNNSKFKFPWPLKNRSPNKSLESVFKGRRSPSPKAGSACDLTPPSKQRGDCDPLCGRKPPKIAPPPPPPSKCPKTCKSKPKFSGLFLRKFAKKEVRSQDCLAWDDDDDRQEGVVRLNSQEKITIRMKKNSPSTEEIRGGNIKVQDGDGHTLYERKNYGTTSGLGDMYNVHRLSTTNTNETKPQDGSTTQMTECKSELSVANLVEIHFKLRVTQGDKTTEINIENSGNNDKDLEEKNIQLDKTSKDVYIAKEETVPVIDDNNKNDINIRIIIKNYKAKPDAKINQEKYIVNDEFSKHISEKFHTVSTGYSDTIEDKDKIPSNIFSVHRATVDLTTSNEMSNVQCKLSENLGQTDVENRNEIAPATLITSSKITTELSSGHHPIVNVSEVITKSTYSLTKTEMKITDDFQELTKENLPVSEEHALTDGTDTDDQDLTVDINNDISMEEKIKTNLKRKKGIREKKKDMLKKVLEKASDVKKTKNKTKIRKFLDVVKTILTSDSSEPEEVTGTGNELANDLTYAAIKPNYFRNTDSMNNYYNVDSATMSSIRECMSDTKDEVKLIYPTEANNSECSDRESDESDEPHPVNGGCFCSTLAARLNMSQIRTAEGPCCCYKAVIEKKDEETLCDMRTEEDFCLHNKTEYADVSTQNSKEIIEINTTTISIVNQVKDVPIVNRIDVAKTEDTVKLKEIKSKEDYIPHTKQSNEYCANPLNRQTVLGISDEDKVIFLYAKPTNVSVRAKFIEKLKKSPKCKHKERLQMFSKPADILQCYETKKAVLEIYAEKTILDDKERIVAKLPKFVYDKENEIQRNYEEIINEYESIFSRNIVMSLNR